MAPAVVVAQASADRVAACVSAFASSNAVELALIAEEVRAWGPVEDANLNKAALVCLDLARQMVAEAPMAEAAESVPDPIDALLDRLEAEPAAIKAIAEEIADGAAVLSTQGDRLERLETALLAYAKPISAAEAAENLTAYKALARVMPDNAAYRDKVALYTGAVDRQARDAEKRKAEIVGRLVRTTAEFDGSSWYRHPSSPRYQDSQSYVTLYVVESGAGLRSLEFFVNYTSRSGWLFVSSAQINVDGTFTQLPTATWSRDNDTEIWEWARFRDQPAMIELARAIAGSDRAVIRFNGQQFYDDHVISAQEKTVLRDMLLAWEVMKP